MECGKPMNRPHKRMPKRQINRGLCGPDRDYKPLGTNSNLGLMTVTHWYLMTYLRATRLGIVDSEPQNSDSTLQIVNSKLQIVALELQNSDWMLQIVNSKLQIVNSKLQIVDLKLQNLDLKLQNLDSKLQDIDSKLQTLDSTLQNRAKMAENSRHQGPATAERNSPNTPQTRKGG